MMPLSERSASLNSMDSGKTTCSLVNANADGSSCNGEITHIYYKWILVGESHLLLRKHLALPFLLVLPVLPPCS